MIGLILLPFYFLLNLVINNIIIKWLSVLNLFNGIECVKHILLVIQAFLTLTLYIALIIRNRNIKRILNIVGNYYLGLIIYTSLVLLIIYLFNTVFKINLSNNIKIIEGFFALLIVVFIMIYGNINSNIIHTTRYCVNINKKSSLRQLKIILIADLHLGYNKGIKLVKNMVNKVNKENPDIVLIAGDIFDNDYDAIDKPNAIIKELKKIKTKYGVYSTYGNHDVEEKVLLGFTFNHKKKKYVDSRMNRFLKLASIKLLQDNYVLIDNIYIYGRLDKEKNKSRKSSKDIGKLLDNDKPKIVLDHVPKELTQLSQAGVDLDLSGHTHDGQIFPLNLLVKLIFKNSYGIKKFNDMTSVVTSGVGVYGPNMRVLSKSEIVSIKVIFK